GSRNRRLNGPDGPLVPMLLRGHRTEGPRSIPALRSHAGAWERSVLREARPVANGTTVWPEAQRTLSEQPKGECEVNPVHTDHYPSRQHDEPRWQERLDPVVYRSDLANAPIPAELIERFERDGYLVIPNLFSAEEVAFFREELDRMRQDPAVADSGKTIKEPDSGAIRSVFAIHKDTALFARVAADERIAAVARFILGGDIYVHQSRMNFKPGFTGKEFYWHSDFETWHVEDGLPRMRTLSCSILLTDNE